MGSIPEADESYPPPPPSQPLSRQISRNDLLAPVNVPLPLSRQTSRNDYLTSINVMIHWEPAQTGVAVYFQSLEESAAAISELKSKRIYAEAGTLEFAYTHRTMDLPSTLILWDTDGYLDPLLVAKTYPEIRVEQMEIGTVAALSQWGKVHELLWNCELGGAVNVMLPECPKRGGTECTEGEVRAVLYDVGLVPQVCIDQVRQVLKNLKGDWTAGIGVKEP